jgi:hypothetical protein
MGLHGLLQGQVYLFFFTHSFYLQFRYTHCVRNNMKYIFIHLFQSSLSALFWPQKTIQMTCIYICYYFSSVCVNLPWGRYFKVPAGDKTDPWFGVFLSVYIFSLLPCFYACANIGPEVVWQRKICFFTFLILLLLNEFDSLVFMLWVSKNGGHNTW